MKSLSLFEVEVIWTIVPFICSKKDLQLIQLSVSSGI